MLNAFRDTEQEGGRPRGRAEPRGVAQICRAGEVKHQEERGAMNVALEPDRVALDPALPLTSGVNLEQLPYSSSLSFLIC